MGQVPGWFTRLATLGQLLLIPPVSPLQARAGSVGSEGMELLKQTQKCSWKVEGVVEGQGEGRQGQWDGGGEREPQKAVGRGERWSWECWGW